jgi:uncharacterized protein DUF3309
MSTLLIILLVLALCGFLTPVGTWGTTGGNGLSIVVVILILLLIFGRI